MDSATPMIVVLGIGVLVGSLLLLRLATRASGDAGTGQADRRRRPHAWAALGAGVMAFLLAGLIVAARDRGDDGSRSAALADTSAALLQDPNRTGPWPAMAIAVGVFVVAAGIVTVLRSQNRRY